MYARVGGKSNRTVLFLEYREAFPPVSALEHRTENANLWFAVDCHLKLYRGVGSPLLYLSSIIPSRGSIGVDPFQDLFLLIGDRAALIELGFDIGYEPSLPLREGSALRVDPLYPIGYYFLGLFHGFNLLNVVHLYSPVQETAAASLPYYPAYPITGLFRFRAGAPHLNVILERV